MTGRSMGTETSNFVLTFTEQENRVDTYIFETPLSSDVDVKSAILKR